MTSVSRRTFLGTAAAASVSAVAAPAMAASTSGNNLPAKWDDTVEDDSEGGLQLVGGVGYELLLLLPGPLGGA